MRSLRTNPIDRGDPLTREIRTDESRIHFEELGQEEYPRPHPKPILVDRWRGHDVSGGGGSAGFCDTTKSRIDFSVSYTADYSGVGSRGRTLARCHARVPIPVRTGGVE
jgi:hypothetical protein